MPTLSKERLGPGCDPEVVHCLAVQVSPIIFLLTGFLADYAITEVYDKAGACCSTGALRRCAQMLVVRTDADSIISHSGQEPGLLQHDNPGQDRQLLRERSHDPGVARMLPGLPDLQGLRRE